MCQADVEQQCARVQGGVVLAWAPWTVSWGCPVGFFYYGRTLPPMNSLPDLLQVETPPHLSCLGWAALGFALTETGAHCIL